MVSETQKKQLVEAACAARKNAYAPYSNYHVGAAVLSEDGQIFSGVNVENVSFGITICAERTAVVKAVSDGVRQILAVAICTNNMGSPCGICRQTLVEFGGDIPVLLADGQGNVRETSLYTLLPDHFGPQNLPRTS